MTQTQLRRSLAVLTAGLLTLGTVQPAGAVALERVQRGFARNVIVMIPDGTSVDGLTLTRWAYNDGKPLNLDAIASGLMRTHNSDTVIGDSAPAGTAMATGVKTQDKLIGIRPAAATLYGAVPAAEHEVHAPVASILEAAKLSGRATGIVATAEIQHATPADFSAHATHRNQYTNIGEQQVYQNMNVVLGGGRDYLKPDPKGSTDPMNRQRIDREDMEATLGQQGYQVVTTRDGLMNASGGKVWGAFAPAAMSKNLGRPASEPSLAEMTKKAIDLLSGNNGRGFFLMVEGSQPDWAAHSNHPVALTHEIKAFDDAVGVALEYARQHPDTLVIVAADHGNGGITIGNRATSRNYPEIPLEPFVKHLRAAKVTEDTAATLINPARDNVKAVMADNFGLTDLTGAEEKAIREAKGVDAAGKAFDNSALVIGQVISDRSLLGWTSGGHTGEEVPLYVYTANPLNQLTGTVQNTDVAKYAARAMNLDLERATRDLFVHQRDIEALGIGVEVDSTDAQNLKFVLTGRSGQRYVFHRNKSYFETNGQKQDFNGVVVYNDRYVFIPRAALNQVK